MPQTYDTDALLALAEQLDKLVEDLPIERQMEKDQARQLMNLGQGLGAAASNLRLMAVQAILAETTTPVAALTAATQQAREVIARIQAVSQLITIVGDVLVLAQVVATQKWGLVPPAFKNLKAALAPV
jgi:hypothetical protein